MSSFNCTHIAIEMCGASKRVTANNFIYYIYILGELVVVVFAYFIRDFKPLYTAYTSVMVAFLFYFWYVPESPRWLLAKNKNNEAYKVFKRIAQSNDKHDLNELESIRTNNRLDSIDLKILKLNSNGHTGNSNTNFSGGDQHELNKACPNGATENKTVICQVLKQ